MAAEIELKLGLPAYVLEDLRAWLSGQYGPGQLQEMRNRYLDTPDQALWSRRVAVRLRQKNDQWLLTVKGKGGQSGGLHTRLEWEWPVAGPETDADKLTGTGLLSEAEVRALQPIFDTDFQRRVWVVLQGASALEIALDEGEIRAGHQRVPICELEVELLEGSPDAVVDWAHRLADTFPLWPATASKAQRGYVLAGLASHQPESPLERWSDWCQHHVAPLTEVSQWQYLSGAQAQKGRTLAAQILDTPGLEMPASPEAWQQLLSRVTQRVLDQSRSPAI